MDSYKDIPSDIIELLILPKLPSKSLLKFMSVSKSWYSFIKSPKFIASHLNHHKSVSRQTNNQLILQRRRCHANELLTRLRWPIKVIETVGRKPQPYYLYHYNKDNPGPHHPRIKLRRKLNKVQTSYDGFICLSNVIGDLMLWNPSINKFQYIPSSPIFRVLRFIVGFGYNSLEDNYKLVKIRYDFNNNNNNNLPVHKQSCAHVYSLNRQGHGMNSGWIEVSVPKFIDATVTRTSNCCFANELIHWIIFRQNSTVAAASIMTFDPRTNCFGEIMFPEILNAELKTGLELAVINNNVAVVEFIADKETVIVWRMEESKSWKPMYTIKLSEQCLNRKSNRQQEVVITTSSGILIVFWVNSHNSGVLNGALPMTYGETYGCTESLVLLD